MLGAMSSDPRPGRRLRSQVEGLTVLGGMVGLMWLLEVINTADSNGLDGDGIVARNVGRLWGILTSPFIHASFQHLIANTIPLVFLGLIVALRGARRLLRVSAVVILFGGLGTWLIGPSGVSTIGASGLVFGYATYLLARGFFDRKVLELLIGLLVAVVWGGALLASLLPHAGVSWQGHLCGGIAGVVAAWWLARRRGIARSGGTAPALAARP